MTLISSRVTRQGYNTPGKGWLCLEQPLEPAGLPGLYGYSARLWLIQTLVEEAQRSGDLHRQARIARIAERVMHQLAACLPPPDPIREQLRQALYGPLPLVPSTALRQAA